MSAIRSTILCVLLGASGVMVGRQASAAHWPICPGKSITVGTSNNKNQHPEIAYAFWESPSNPAFSNGTNTPSRTQWIGMMLSTVNNGQYWAELSQYGHISPPRLAPYATLWQGTKNGDAPGNQTFTENDVNTYIADAITAGNFPLPQANDNSIYMVITPSGSVLKDCAGSAASCCNWPASYNGTPYIATGLLGRHVG
jgi:hypothetical protein